MRLTGEGKYSIRKARLNDIETLVSHHCVMFKEILDLQGKKVDDLSHKKMEEADRKKLTEEFPKELCHAWIVEYENKKIVASGAISICSFVPTPENPNYIVAYLHSVYTEKEHRGNGLATKIIEAARSFCHQNSIAGIILYASDEGRPVYEKIGFKTIPSFMHLLV